MNEANRQALEMRILLHATIGKDGRLTAEILENAGFSAVNCPDTGMLLEELNAGAGALMIVEESLDPETLALLGRYIAIQPTWADIPVLLLTRHGADSAALYKAAHILGNVTLLERPLRTVALISAVRTALRARERQYQVREANQRKDEFLASLSHELRNPLAPIRTSMHILKRMYPAASGVNQVREVVERQVSHLTRLVEDLLDVARITSGKIVLQRERVQLASVVSHAVEICTPMLESSQHKLDTSMPSEKIVIDADPVRVVQSLANILGNAIKYTLQPGRISLSVTTEGNSVKFRVKDRGIGMSSEAISHIFEMFSQTDSSTGRPLGGLGIGLSLARRFAEMHGGTIAAASEGLGRGSEFVLTLPVIVAPDAQEEISDPKHLEDETISARNRQVLVVDDNRDGADMLQRLFEADGFTVYTAYDGLEAVETVRKSRPDIVVMDIGMPGMDGYQAVREIRRQPGGDGILMIALTGWGQQETRKLAEEAGFDHHLVKPVDFDILKGFLERADH